MYIQKRRKFKFKFYGLDDEARILPEQKPNIYPTYLPESASLEEKTLEKNIFSSLIQMNIFYTESLEIEQKIAEFVEEYYSRVGESVNTIIILDEQIVEASFHKQLSTDNNITANLKHIFFKDISANNTPSKPSTIPVNESSLEGTARTLYRTLAKSYHPDIIAQNANIDDIETDIIHTINEAYSQNHIGSLWRLTFEQDWKGAANLTPIERLELLQHYNDKITKAMQQIANHRKEVTHSPEYDLYQKHIEANIQGYDFTAQVEQDLHNEIIAKHRRIAYLKAIGRLTT